MKEVNNMKKSKGFTLLEVVIVLAILGIMSVIVVKGLSSAHKKIKPTATIAGFSWYRPAQIMEYTQHEETGFELPENAYDISYVPVDPNRNDIVITPITFTYIDTSGIPDSTEYIAVNDLKQFEKTITINSAEKHQPTEEEIANKLYKYKYKVDKWTGIQRLEARGDDKNPMWPSHDEYSYATPDNPKLGDKQLDREINNDKYYVIIFENENETKTHMVELEEEDWLSYKDREQVMYSAITNKISHIK